MEEGLIGLHESHHLADSCKSCARTDFSMQPSLFAASETRMEILIAIELIVGAILVLVFWYKSPELILSRRLSHRVLDLYDDEENDDAMRPPSSVRSHSSLKVSLSLKDRRP
jgi:hypothetical protein